MAPLPNSTFFPTQSQNTRDYQDIGVLVNPVNPSSPSVVDRSGNIIGTWDSTQKKFIATDPKKVVTSDGMTAEVFLTTNKTTLEQNTTTAIEKTGIKDAYYTSQTYEPYNTWRDGQNPNATQTLTAIPALASFSNASRTNFGVARYPSNRKTDQDCILFEFKKYGSIPLDPKNPASLKRTNKSIAGVITLPIQTGINDSNTVQWGEDRINPIELAGAVSAINAAGTSGKPAEFAKNLIGGLGDTIENYATGPEASNIRAAIVAYFAGQAVGNQNLLSRMNGAVLNPNLELLFQGPQLRSFNFNFQLTPRSKDDAEQIRFIIRRFKQGMAVQRSSAELFLSAPYVFGIKYVFAKNNPDDPNPYLPLIKDCALTNFNVDYTPDGSYMTYEDGSMTSYRLTMQFQELTPIYEDDYAADGNKDTNIGY